MVTMLTYTERYVIRNYMQYRTPH